MKLPRFKLRTLFMLIVLISIPMGWVAYRRNSERKQVQFLARTGAVRLYGLNLEPCLVNVPPADIEEARSLFPEVKLINPEP